MLCEIYESKELHFKKNRHTSPRWAHSLLSKKPMKQHDVKNTLIQFSNNGIRFKNKKTKTALFKLVYFPFEYGVCYILLKFFCEVYSI